ncbi:transcriptional regulator [Pseudaeromonas sharmana]|uniref:Transcriptional regulator n=1 Tax=Pseudaeromonas sharmana TaxID=328412 RepID=A0ABV8CMH6_9GAMM
MPNTPPLPDTERLALNAERQLVFTVLTSVVKTVGSIVGKNTEVVLHDLTNPAHSVVAIANGHITGRVVGSPVLAGPGQDLGFNAVVQTPEQTASPEPVVLEHYQTRLASGAVLHSATAIYRDSSGTPFAGFCINADLSGLHAARACLDQLLGTSSVTEVKSIEQPDMELLMTEIIQSALNTTASSNRAMKKQAKLEAVRQMHERGMFIVKGGIEKAAAALGVSRYTIYNYLDEIKSMPPTQTAER